MRYSLPKNVSPSFPPLFDAHVVIGTSGRDHFWLLTEHDHGMVKTVHEAIASLGGLARTSELLAAGFDDEWIRIAGRYGRIIDAGWGWWATKEVSPLVLQARRAGGRLACVSALQHHGLQLPDNAGLHISIERGARRPRDDTVIVHWSRTPLAGDRHAVSIAVAIRQARACRGVRAGTL
jgi:hypothetical protein